GQGLRQRGRAGDGDHHHDRDQQGEPADERHEEGAGGGGLAAVAGPGDQQEGGQGGDLPAREEEDQVVGQDESDHAEREGRHPQVEAALATGVEVLGGVQEDGSPDDQGDHHEDEAESVQAQGQV